MARRPKSPMSLAQRSRIVLACADGLDNVKVAQRLGVNEATVGKWRRRFVAKRLDGLVDNLVERGFAELTRRLLKRAAHKTVTDLTGDLNAWIATWNDDPRPFVWHKTADQILDTLNGYLQRTSAAGH